MNFYVSKNLKSKYSQKSFDHTKKSIIDAIKSSSNRFIQKPVEAAGDLIGNKKANKVQKVSKNLQQNNSETITNEYDKEMLKERYVSPDERQENVDELRLK